MQSLTQPTLLLKPFCQDGDKNQIPVQNDSLVDPQLADLTNGFPEITSKPPAQGGLPPERRDFNALGYLTTSYDWFYQAGGTFTFNQTISDAIGGYPLNARLWYVDNNGLVSILRSTVGNNTNNFLTNSSVIGEVGSGKPWVIDRFRGLSSQYDLFDHKWSDYQLNDQSWLRADTFSWQDGTFYADAYNHLVADYNGGISQTETIGSYTITYRLASDGHKITTDETNVANIYNESGVAWYYILDTTNQRFKLPRTKYGFVGLRDNVGNYVAESLPKPKLIMRTDGSSSTDADLDIIYGHDGYTATTPSLTSGSDEYMHRTYTDTSDNLKYMDIIGNSYQDNAPVQQRGTQMYLYFYVGQFSQTATEQTAGLNAELFNSKVDLNAANLSTAGKSLISGFGMPSGTSENLTLLASGNSYEAPANGYFLITKLSTAAGQYIDMRAIVHINIISTGAGQSLSLYIPCRKGDSCTINYNVAGTTSAFKFIYAEGEQNV